MGGLAHVDANEGAPSLFRHKKKTLRMERLFDLSDSAFKVERLMLLRHLRQTSVNVSANDALALDLCEGPVEPWQ